MQAAVSEGKMYKVFGSAADSYSEKPVRVELAAAAAVGFFLWEWIGFCGMCVVVRRAEIKSKCACTVP